MKLIFCISAFSILFVTELTAYGDQRANSGRAYGGYYNSSANSYYGGSHYDDRDTYKPQNSTYGTSSRYNDYQKDSYYQIKNVKPTRIQTLSSINKTTINNKNTSQFQNSSNPPYSKKTEFSSTDADPY